MQGKEEAGASSHRRLVHGKEEAGLKFMLQKRGYGLSDPPSGPFYLLPSDCKHLRAGALGSPLPDTSCSCSSKIT